MRWHLRTTTLALSIAGVVCLSLTTSASPISRQSLHAVPSARQASVSDHLSSGSHNLVVTVDKLRRTFIVNVPSGKEAVNRALVLVYHGAEDTATSTIQGTNILNNVSARGDVIAFLQGYDDTWNEGSGTTPASRAHVNDIAYTAAVISRLRRLVSFDPYRVAAVGFSNGAIMVEDVGCRLSSLISLIIPVEGQLSTVQSASCSLKRPVSVYEIHGTGDTIIPYRGGYFSTSIGEDTVLSAPNSVLRWAHLDGCSAGPVTSSPSSTISLSTYSKCRNLASVTLRTIAGGGHDWPSNIGQLVVQELSKFPSFNHS